MSKHFRPWNIDQTLLLPPNVRDFVPKDHVSRFIVGLVRESHPKPFRFRARSMWRRTLLFHRVFDEAEALAGMPHRKVVQS